MLLATVLARQRIYLRTHLTKEQTILPSEIDLEFLFYRTNTFFTY